MTMNEDETFIRLQRTSLEEAIRPNNGTSFMEVADGIVKGNIMPMPEWYNLPTSRGWTWEDIIDECRKWIEVNKSWNTLKIGPHR